MKKYIIPAINVANIENEILMLDGSTTPPGVNTSPVGGGSVDARDRDLFDWNTDEE